MNIRNFDMNLLFVFKTLFEERNVTRASKKIGMAIGTVIASPCATLPVRTPRLIATALKPNVAAASNANTPPNT